MFCSSKKNFRCSSGILKRCTENIWIYIYLFFILKSMNTYEYWVVLYACVDFNGFMHFINRITTTPTDQRRVEKQNKMLRIWMAIEREPTTMLMEKQFSSLINRLDRRKFGEKNKNTCLKAKNTHIHNFQYRSIYWSFHSYHLHYYLFWRTSMWFVVRLISWIEKRYWIL